MCNCPRGTHTHKHMHTHTQTIETLYLQTPYTHTKYTHSISIHHIHTLYVNTTHACTLSTPYIHTYTHIQTYKQHKQTYIHICTHMNPMHTLYPTHHIHTHIPYAYTIYMRVAPLSHIQCLRSYLNRVWRLQVQCDNSWPLISWPITSIDYRRQSKHFNRAVSLVLKQCYLLLLLHLHHRLM